MLDSLMQRVEECAHPESTGDGIKSDYPVHALEGACDES